MDARPPRTGALIGLIGLVFALALTAACGSDATPTATSTPTRTASATAAASSPASGASTSDVPSVYKVRLVTTKGDIVIEVHKDWAPLGAQRFYDLVEAGYYNNMPWFRVITGFMAQTGINPDPAATASWRNQRLKDDPVTQSNTSGMVTFAMGGPNTRTTHFFINTANNAQLDKSGFAPFGKVVTGMDVVTKLFAIGDSTVDQGRANTEGEAYFKTFTNLDRITTASVE